MADVPNTEPADLFSPASGNCQDSFDTRVTGTSDNGEHNANHTNNASAGVKLAGVRDGIDIPEVIKPEMSDSSASSRDVKHDVINRRGRSGYAPIKPEFLVPDYKPTLRTEYLSSEMKCKMENKDKDSKPPEEENDDDETLNDGNEDEEREGEPPSKKAKLKGRNKHRPRNEKIQAKDRICPAIKGNRECAFGDNCKFSHDKEDFLSKKLPELEGPCYLFDTFGHCQYGIACRFAKNHLSADLQNVTNEELYRKMKNSKFLNELSSDVRQKLWKKKYNFKLADQVFKQVQKDFRGWGDSHGSVKTEQNANQGKQVDILSASTNKDSALEKSQPLSGSVNETSLVSDVSLKSSETEAQTSPSQSSNPQISQTGTVDNGSSSLKRTLGCVTDEGEVRIHPREKVKFDFRNKLYLAPLTTVGNLPFRRICKGLGADVTCGEMALATQLLKGKQSEWSLIKRHPCEDIFGVQVCGSYPDSMTRCAQLLTETCDVDFIDINCGCPIDLVYKRGGGSALMGKATKLEQICRSMIGVMGDTPLTVKLRTGVFDNKSVAHQIIPRLRDAGVSLVTVHGRSREQRYTKQADWDYIAQCANAGAPMPVFGNGDILSYEEANLHMQYNGVSGVMIARGALIKPWIFTEIKEQRHWDISSGERLDILRKYTNYGLEHWGSDHQGVENTRRFLLEWLSFLHRYIPVGVLEQVPQRINERPPYYVGRNDLETLMASANCADWIKISEMLLGPVPPSFHFLPKHKANAYQ